MSTNIEKKYTVRVCRHVCVYVCVYISLKAQRIKLEEKRALCCEQGKGGALHGSHLQTHWGEDLMGLGWIGWPEVCLESPRWDRYTSLYGSTALLKGVIKKLVIVISSFAAKYRWASCLRQKTSTFSQWTCYLLIIRMIQKINIKFSILREIFLCNFIYFKLSWLCFTHLNILYVNFAH